MSENWEILLKLAHQFLMSSGIPGDRWTMGGGTVLMLHYNHRVSRDIDIFFNDAQYITFLTPRINDAVAGYTEDYDEQSNFLKLKFSEGEIDYIVAPSLTGSTPEILDIAGISVRTDTPEEIVIKKMFYRAESLKVRDILDIAVTVRHKKQEMMDNLRIFSSKLEIISDRLKLINKNYFELVKALEVIDHELLLTAPSIVETFIKDCMSEIRGDL